MSGLKESLQQEGPLIWAQAVRREEPGLQSEDFIPVGDKERAEGTHPQLMDGSVSVGPRGTTALGDMLGL